MHCRGTQGSAHSHPHKHRHTPPGLCACSLLCTHSSTRTTTTTSSHGTGSSTRQGVLPQHRHHTHRRASMRVLAQANVMHTTPPQTDDQTHSDPVTPSSIQQESLRVLEWPAVCKQVRGKCRGHTRVAWCVSVLWLCALLCGCKHLVLYVCVLMHARVPHLQSLPRQSASQKVQEHVAQAFQVITPAWSCEVDACV